MITPIPADGDFDTAEQLVTLQGGTSNTGVQFGIVDDLILEPVEEGFLALLELESAMFPDLIDFDAERVTLLRIRDNDGKAYCNEKMK